MRKILILAASPKNCTHSRLDEEVRDINEGLRRSHYRNDFKVTQQWAVRPRDLQRAMLDELPQVVHFSGHGEGEVGLFFEDNVGNAKLVTVPALASLFKLFAEKAHIECVVLNGCYSQSQAEAIADYVPYVIGMTQTIGDRAAIEFSVGFYDALGNGETVEFAFRSGTVAMALEGTDDANAPVLISGRVDPVINNNRNQRSSNDSLSIKPSQRRAEHQVLQHISHFWKRYKKVTALSAAAVVLGIAGIFWLVLPTLSKQYNKRGQLAQTEAQFGAAEQNYNRAVRLNPRNFDAHYNLGTLYEDIQKLDQAETQYWLAVGGDFPEAYSNLARLYLQSPENSVNEALALLKQGLQLSEAQNSFPETQFSLYKNLGWALLQQKEDPLAVSALEEAISIYEQLPAAEQEYVANPGSAYCLVAQAQEVTGQTDVLPAWQRCCQLGDRSNPEENSWLTMARDRFDDKGLNYEKVCQTNASRL